MSVYAKYIDVPKGVEPLAHASGTGGQAGSEAQKVLADGTVDQPATLEPFAWSLDGGCVCYDTPACVGFWSADAADLGGGMAVNPSISITLDIPITTTGVTLFFFGCPKQVTAKWYSGAVLLAEAVKKVDAAFEGSVLIEQTVESYDRLVLTFVGAEAGHYIKVKQIILGQVVIWDYGTLTAVSMVNELDPTGGQVSADTLHLELYERSDRDYRFQYGQRVELWHNGSLTAVQYINSSTRKGAGRYEIDCQSAVSMLDGTCLGGMYQGEALSVVLSGILGNDVDYDVDEEYLSAPVYGYLPVCTQREAIQQIGIAFGLHISTAHDGKLHLFRPEERCSGEITSAKMLGLPSLEQSRLTGVCKVIAHSYTVTTEEETLLDGEPIEGDSVLVTFDEPHHSYTITGGTLVEQGANHVMIAANGNVTVKGKKYAHAAKPYQRRNAAATMADRNNMTSIEECTLVGDSNATEVLGRLYKNTLLREKVTAKIICAGEETGKIYTCGKPWKDAQGIEGYITEMNHRYTAGGHTATITLMGRTVDLPGAYAMSGDWYSGEDGLYTWN